MIHNVIEVIDSLHHVTDQYLDDYQEGLLNPGNTHCVSECLTCISLSRSNVNDKTLRNHVTQVLNTYRNIYIQYQAIINKNLSLDTCTVNKLHDRKTNILNILMLYSVDFKTRVQLESIIVKIDKRLLLNDEQHMYCYKRNLTRQMYDIQLEINVLETLIGG